MTKTPKLLTEAQLNAAVRWSSGDLDSFTKPQLAQIVVRLRAELAKGSASEALARAHAEQEIKSLQAELAKLRYSATEPRSLQATLQLDDSPEARALIEQLAEHVKRPELPETECECGEPATVHKCAEHDGTNECPDCEEKMKCPQCSEPVEPPCENCEKPAKHVLCDDCFAQENRAPLFDELVAVLEEPVRDDFELRHRRYEIERILTEAGCQFNWPVHARLAV